MISLYDSAGTLIESNDNRLDLDGVINPLLPSNPSESFLTAILPPGSYTAIVEGVNGTTGVALVELYDLEPGSSRVANISTRGDIACCDGSSLSVDSSSAALIRRRSSCVRSVLRWRHLECRIHFPTQFWNYTTPMVH